MTSAPSTAFIEHAEAVEGRQDRVAVIEHPEGLIAVVADGAGGISGGAQAAQAVIDQVTTLPWSTDPDEWSERLRHVDRQIDHGETTAIVAAVNSHSLVLASVGDSDAWAFGPYPPIWMTRGQIRKPLVGSGRAEPRAIAFEFLFPTSIVMATDGLWKYATVDRIAPVALQSATIAARELVELVRLPSGTLPDDVGVIVCRLAPSAGD